MASVVAWELHGPGISKEASGHQNMGKRHALMSRLMTLYREGCSDGCTRPLERAHCRSVSRRLEELMNGKDGRSQKPDLLLRSFVLAGFRNVGEDFAADDPATPRCQIRRGAYDDGATGCKWSGSCR
jgi:hypothetical protein